MLQLKSLSGILLLAIIGMLPFKADAQNNVDYNLFLKSGTILPTKNIGEGANFRISSGEEKKIVIIQFEVLPTDAVKAELKNQGIELLDYVPNHAYVATVKSTVNMPALIKAGARSIISLNPEQKMEPSLAIGGIPAHAEKVKGKVDIWLNYAKSFSYDEVRNSLADRRIEVVSDALKNYEIIELRILPSQLKELAALSFVQYIQTVPMEESPLLDKSTTNSRANILGSTAPAGFNLHGSGVTIGVGDNANPMTHVDLNNRVLNHSQITNGSHGMSVIGIVAGAGVVNEKYTGYAPKARVVARYNGEILDNAEKYSRNNRMVLTNNSYGIIPIQCSHFGEYYLQSYLLDRQAQELPFLQHVFAAGNSGSASLCSTLPVGFGTVLSGYTAAKNVLSVGNTNASGLISSSSSKGPVKDGRTKPDLTAQGTGVYSTIPGDKYAANTGTSFAAPAVTGGLALLYERYRQMYNQADPKNALMKALLCNGAADLGSAGPDYTYGYGWLNLFRSLEMLNGKTYFEENVTNGGTKSHSVPVPAETSQLKIMLYWNDPAASVYSGRVLVNNLDLRVTAPDGSIVLPKILDRSNVVASATTGIDDINNMEQIVIDNPLPGTYSVEVIGKVIPQGPQNYFVVYDAIGTSTKLTYPIGKEHIAGKDVISISWESYGNPNSTFNVEYSLNNGASWNVIDAAVEPQLRQLSWTIPDVYSENAKVRIIQNSTGVISESAAFTILDAPEVTLSPVQCEGYIGIEWLPVPGATDYEVMMLKGDEMKPIAVTTALNYTFNSLSTDSIYFVSVRGRINGNPGRRGIAVSRLPNDGTCLGTISDNDLKIASIASPAGSGRFYTSTELLASQPIVVRIKNLDDIVSTQPIQIGYSIGDDNSAIYWETVTPAILPGSVYEHRFSKTANMNAAGTYRLKVFVKKSSDLTELNNSLVQIFKQLNNLPIILPFYHQAKTLASQEVSSDLIGLAGGERFDFTNSTSFGRLRTTDSSGVFALTDKGIFLDVSRYTASGNLNTLVATFNLRQFNAKTEELWLHFGFLSNIQSYNDIDGIWIRGKDTNPWVLATYLNAYRNAPIEISKILSENGQVFTESFQIRWDQFGTNTLSPNSGTGFGIANIIMTKPTSDLQVLSITPPQPYGCGYGKDNQIVATVKNNSSDAVINVPIKMQVNGGPIISGIVDALVSGQTRQFTFSDANVDLSSAGTYTIKVWTEKKYDTKPANDLVQIVVNNKSITSFPYLQNFEKDNGGWYTEGTNSSWQYGIPSSAKINTAASGGKAWKTRLSGNYNNNETSYLYSPCFYIADLKRPALSFSVAVDLDTKICSNQACDLAYVEYSFSGTSWTRLESNGTGTNWYNRTDPSSAGWSIQDDTRWHVSTAEFPNLGCIRFRFVLKTDPSFNREGISIDDIHIYDLENEIFSSTMPASGDVQETASGKNWVNFTKDNEIIASIRSGDINLGKTIVQAYINQSSVPNNGEQYYLNRSFTIRAENTLTDSVTVRLYFPDSEVKALINAAGCASCATPENAYRLSISKYSSPDPSVEDGILGNDKPGSNWLFLPSDKITKVPYAKGYYAEFKTMNFSEFWLAKTFIGTSAALPVNLVSFTAKRSSRVEDKNDIVLDWLTTSEKDFSHFEIERAVGGDAVRGNLFSKINEVKSGGNTSTSSHYFYTDHQPQQTETLYYRLKIVDLDNTFSYSTIKSVMPNSNIAPRLYPNPSNGVFNLEFQEDTSSPVTVKIFDMLGVLVMNTNYQANASLQKRQIDLSSPRFKTGLYLIVIAYGQHRETFKVVKQ